METILTKITHRIREDAQLAYYADYYKPQLDLYREGVERLWPNRPVISCLLFTDGGYLVKIPGQATD